MLDRFSQWFKRVSWTTVLGLACGIVYLLLGSGGPIDWNQVTMLAAALIATLLPSPVSRDKVKAILDILVSMAREAAASMSRQPHRDDR